MHGCTRCGLVKPSDYELAYKRGNIRFSQCSYEGDDTNANDTSLIMNDACNDHGR